MALTSSWPGLSRPSTSLNFDDPEDVDARDIGVRKHAVLRTAMRGHDDGNVSPLFRHPRLMPGFQTNPASQDFARELDAPSTPAANA
jgi:hypothetical protein